MHTRSLLSLALVGAAFTLPAAAQDWQAYEGYAGRVTLNFHPEAMEQAGLQVIELTMTEDPDWYPGMVVDGEPLMFRANADTTSLIALRGADGNFPPYGVIGGQFQTDEGFTLFAPSTGAVVDFHNFVVRPQSVRNDGPGGEQDPDYFFLNTEDDLVGDFKLCYVKIFYGSNNGYEPAGPDSSHVGVDLKIKSFDLIATENLARKLGKPEIEGMLLGAGQMDVNALPYEGRWEHPQGQNVFTPYGGGAASPPGGAFQGSFKDVSLGILNNMTAVGHVGTFPNGRAGLSMATTSCNLGNVNVPWLKPETVLQEDHPGIGMNLFRQKEYFVNGTTVDRFEQVGTSWVKHGFFALSNSQCIPCQQPSNGTFLGVGCSDTYGTSNNANRFWLGPRDEWDPHAGTWEADFSFFDGIPAGDGLRNEFGNGTGSVNHRLESFDADLDNPDSDYYYEAIYLVRGDQDIENNIGSRRTTMFWGGSNWVFSTPGGNPLIEGPALRERWGDVRTVKALQDTPGAVLGDKSDDGRVVLSSKVTDLGGGLWRYEYALYNWTLNREVRSFSVPQFAGAHDFYFHDIDDQASNDWAVTLSGKNITWEFPDVFLPGHKVAGPLGWGELFNFGFTSPFPPATHDAILGIQNPGAGGDSLAVVTQAPGGGVSLSAEIVAPETDSTIDLVVRGGTTGAKIAAVAVNGLPITPLILTPAAIPFSGGEARLPLFVPASVAGLDIDFLAAEFDTSVVSLSNIFTLDIQ